MKIFNIKIVDPIGIHARPASTIASAASKFSSTISFKFLDEDKIANAKSVINLMSLGAKKDAKIEVTISGDDEENAYKSISDVLVNNNFATIV